MSTPTPETPTQNADDLDRQFASALCQRLFRALIEAVGEDADMFSRFEAFLNATMPTLVNMPKETADRLKALYVATDGLAQEGEPAAQRRHAIDTITLMIAEELSYTHPFEAAVLHAHMELTDAETLLDFYGNL